MRRRCGRWGHRLRDNGFKITIPRETILQVLENNDEHLSPEEIYLKVHDLYPNIGLTTVYRTLEMLLNLGMVTRLDFGEGKSRYELSENISHKKHHHHLICNICGKITDYSEFMDEEVAFLKNIEKKLGKKYKFDIQDHSISFYGRCERCY